MNIVHMIVRCVQHVGLSDRIILTSPGPLMLEMRIGFDAQASLGLYFLLGLPVAW